MLTERGDACVCPPQKSRGATLSFLSQYPGEDEVLIPPLSYLEIVGEPFVITTLKGKVTVYPGKCAGACVGVLV